MEDKNIIESKYVQLYCCDTEGEFNTKVSVLGKASTGVTRPEYIAFKRNGHTLTGYLKKDENELNENDLEYILTKVGRVLSVSMAEVIRTFEDPLFCNPHSIISVSVVHEKNEEFISFSKMQEELWHDLGNKTIPMTSWIEKWIKIRKRRERNLQGVWEVNAISMEDCETCFQYPFEIAELWSKKHKIKLMNFNESILKMVMFDILVGQLDRTTDNYGLLIDRKQKTAKLAPLFDNSTLRKPGISQLFNSFNYLLIDRYTFAMTAYRRWDKAFLNIVESILNRKQDIYDIINDVNYFVEEEKLDFLEKRINTSMDILTRVINNYNEITEKLLMPFGNEILLLNEIKKIMFENGISPVRLELLGDLDVEPKFRVDTEKESFLVKLSLYDRFSQETIKMMQEVRIHTESILPPSISKNIALLNRQINVYEWLEGINLRDLIRTKTERECYQIGICCGQVLRDIHKVIDTSIGVTYNIDEKLDKCIKILSDREDLLTKRKLYMPKMKEWRKKLKRVYRPVLVHMDYVPKNIIISEDKIYVVDWDSCEVGDPWFDFFDKGLALYPERQALNTGIIDGYFAGSIPQDFWPFFKVLSIFALLQTTVWAINQNDTSYIAQMESHLCNSYDNFKCDIPLWYTLFSST